MLSLYVRAALLLRRWPQVSRDDPKQLGLGVHYAAAGVALVIWIAATLALYLVLALLATKPSRHIGVRPFVYIALLSTLLLVAPPWVSWYLD